MPQVAEILEIARGIMPLSDDMAGLLGSHGFASVPISIEIVSGNDPWSAFKKSVGTEVSAFMTKAIESVCSKKETKALMATFEKLREHGADADFTTLLDCGNRL
jgi:hypothetical protein